MLSDKILYTKLLDAYLPVQLFYDSTNQLVLLSQDDNQLRIWEYSDTLSEKKPLLNVGIVNSIFPSNNNLTWLASSTGLYQFNPNTYKATKVLDSLDLLNQAFNAVIEDSLGNVWLSSFWGIYRYIPKKGRVDHFTQSDGLIAMQYVENSSLYASNGKIYFGGDKGVTVIDPKNIQLNQNVPKIHLIDYKINNEPADRRVFNKGSPIAKLKHNQNTLLFKFAVLEFSDPELNALRFHLIKNRKDTILVDDSNPIQLNLLVPGNYKLDLYAANSDNIWTKKPQSYPFVILPPWYQTWWARLIGLILLFISLYGFYRYRIKQIQNREEFKRKEAEFKQKEAEFKQLAAETETAVLRLQMNPHFIFNSMNSISSYILQKDIDTAYDYLHRFSKLMRSILEQSERMFTTINDEIDLLKLYLDTESMRLEHQLNYNFDIGPSIDPDELLLPTMILQPFVENAIWHGLSSKKEAGFIQVKFQLVQDQLLCEVEDNGVGRFYHQQQNSRQHQSKALSITQRRLELLSKEQAMQSKMEIIDLLNSKGESIGTKIQLSLPILD